MKFGTVRMICVHVGNLNLRSLKHNSLYYLGFRIDPPEKLEETFQELRNLHDIYSTCPDFGVDFVFESEAPQTDPLMQVFFSKSRFELNFRFLFEVSFFASNSNNGIFCLYLR